MCINHELLQGGVLDLLESLVLFIRTGVLRGLSARRHILECLGLEMLGDARATLSNLIQVALQNSTKQNGQDFFQIAHRMAKAFFETSLPSVGELLDADLHAAYSGDPATASYQEIALCYPGIAAVMVYRMAHELLRLGVPLIPRMMSEVAHSQTGIDIHPGAWIGSGLFIDHGTGVVIGETCVIGQNCTLYQGVTLGALSLPRDGSGTIIRGTKRHPTLKDNVVVFANATILGGETIIGHHAVIGSNVRLTQSVAPCTVVSLEKPVLRFKEKCAHFVAEAVQESPMIDIVMGRDYYPA